MAQKTLEELESLAGNVQVIQDSLGGLHAIDATYFAGENKEEWEKKIQNASASKTYGVPVKNEDDQPINGWALGHPVSEPNENITIEAIQVVNATNGYDKDLVKVGDVLDVMDADYKDWVVADVYEEDEKIKLLLTPRADVALKDHTHNLTTENTYVLSASEAAVEFVAPAEGETGDVVTDVDYAEEQEATFTGTEKILELILEDIEFTPTLNEESHGHGLGGDIDAEFTGTEVNATAGEPVAQGDTKKADNNFLYSASYSEGVLSFSYAPVKVVAEGTVSADATGLEVVENTTGANINKITLTGKKASGKYTPEGTITLPELSVTKGKGKVTGTPITVVTNVSGIKND